MSGTMTMADWNSWTEPGFNTAGILADVVGTVRVVWGDGTVENVSTNNDRDGDGTLDSIDLFHSFPSDGVYDVGLRSYGGGDVVRFRANMFASETTDRTYTGGILRDAFITGSGNERINSGGGKDLIVAHGGNDTIFAGDGDDILIGGDGDDVLRGGAGNELLGGGAGNDILYADADGASMYGDEGNDTLVGGADYEFLSGGVGADRLTGGGGADIFGFASVAEGGIGAARDTITDFDSTSGNGEDLLDLGGFGGLAFVTGRFSGDGGGEVRALVRAGYSTVQVDADGNGTVDLEVALLGTQAITADNLIL